MKIGIALPQAGENASPEKIVRAARGAEAIGLDSVWVMDRLLRPTRPVAPFPGMPEAPLPESYGNVLDPLETLAYVAAVTERVQLGTSAVNALLHPPVLLARRLATLDRLSGGRVLAGLAQGWLEDEFIAVGVPRSRRGAGMAEYVEVLRAVWGPDPVRFEGRRYRIPESEIGPKPVAGHVPILFACSWPEVGPATVRAGRVADGLNPYPMARSALAAEVAAFRSAAEAAGRDAGALPVVVRLGGEPGGVADDESLLAGPVERWVDDLAFVASLGIDHAFVDMDAPLDERLSLMEVVRSRVA